ncbi:hypothetical protein ACQK5W_04545 [Pantoea sp. FN060301]|uniref:hypothetical protein n=1 Tax=Pantoea sp. FN060301 TaxID=3420380 RepID=UPI003D17FFC6
MDKTHFYERLMRWQHLHFNDVILRERQDNAAWDKKYEIYIQDKTRSCAQLYIRTTQPGEDMIQVMDEYLRWLHEYNEVRTDARGAAERKNSPAQRSLLNENHHRVYVNPTPSLLSSAVRLTQNAQR